MLVQPGLLSASDGHPVAIERAHGISDIVLICEHAGRRVPEVLGDLGLSEVQLSSHIAWDPGALAVSLLLSEALDATLVHQRFSRLVYDCNRPPEAEDAVVETSEIHKIPANYGLEAVAKATRVEALYRPFHESIEVILAERKQRSTRSVIVTIHSFTPVYNRVKRDVEIGILHDHDSRLADCMLKNAAGSDAYVVRRNEPYSPVDGVTHTLRRHALNEGLLNVMIEIRNDLIADEAGQAAAAHFVSKLLSPCLSAKQEAI